MRTIDVVDGEYTLPKPYRTMPRYALKTPYCTEVHRRNKKTGHGSLHWFNTKHPELGTDKVLVNKEIFQMRFINTAELVGVFWKMIERETNRFFVEATFDAAAPLHPADEIEFGGISIGE